MPAPDFNYKIRVKKMDVRRNNETGVKFMNVEAEIFLPGDPDEQIIKTINLGYDSGTSDTNIRGELNKYLEVFIAENQYRYDHADEIAADKVDTKTINKVQGKVISNEPTA